MKKHNTAFTRLVSLAFGATMLAGCTTAHVSQNNIDNLKNVDEQSHQLMRERLEKESKKLLEENAALRNSVQNIMAEKKAIPVIEPEFNPLDAVQISVSVKDGDAQIILQAIAKQAGLSLLLDPALSEVKRKISMQLSNVPASLVFKQVMTLLDFDGEVKGNVLIVRPFQERVYELNFLQTATTMDYNMGGDVFGANSSSSSGSGGSSTKAMSGSLALTGTGSSESNPYKQLNETLKDILGKKKDQEDDSLPATTSGMPINLPSQNRLSNVSSKSMVRPEKPKGFSAVYSLNEMTGTLYVKARPSQVEAVDKLISQYKSVLGRQVLIEAQLLDVRLSEGNQYGVDWTKLGQDIAFNYGSGDVSLGAVNSTLPNTGSLSRTITIPAVNYGVTDNSAMRLVHSNSSFSAALTALQKYGTVRVLSNPSIRAKNSRPAFISVGRNSQYVAESTSTVNNLGTGSTTTSDVTTSSVFDGIILGFEPFIDAEGKISLTVHPMQSNVDKSSMALIDVGNGTKITLPVIDFKGLTTSLMLKNGDTVVLGGLMDEVASDSGSGVPGVNEIPGIGALFGGQRIHSKETRELIIVLRVTLL
ncbi:MAG: pilus (MSHA type) biogenesis protein MshL [Moraxella osloensis]|nr:pilus (MSHA type) biogenesis protein MshL [Moraxella osloensis]MBD3767418.1 pilus (MSHA type) biogenesis protein MshL [Gammaproteobacteria bacterium]